MKKFPLFLNLIITFLILPFYFIFAYDAQTTHFNLTEIAVDYYNTVFPLRKVSNQEKEWLKIGSIKEDDGIRSINHFYDPVYNTTYKIFGIENLLPALTAKEWSQNQLFQALYDPKYLASLGLINKSPIFSSANRTWQRAIYEYIKGNYQEAFISLGHILHLIEDMSVPEHTRANIHIYFLPNASSYYELYTARNDSNFYQKLKENLKNKFESILKTNLNDYFDYLANYSNNNFFSPDTIDNLKYKLPEIVFYDVPEINPQTKITEYFLMGMDENKNLYHLAQKKALSWRLQEGFTNYTLANEKILNDYWERLSLKAVITSSGVIDLFFKEVEKAKLNPDFLRENEKNLLLSFVGEIQSLIKSLSNKSDYVIVDSKIPLNDSYDSLNKENRENNSLSLNNSNNISKIPSTTTSSNKSSSSEISFKNCQFNDGNNKNSLKEIIFNEIAWMGSLNSPNDEWIEIKNISSKTVDLSYWQIRDQDEQIKFTFPQGTKILPNEILLLERNSDNSVPFVKADFIYSGALNNSNEGLRLFNNYCQLEDEILANPNWPAGDNNLKRTMERDKDFSWYTYSGESNNGIFGTPKKENSLKRTLLNEISNNQLNNQNQLIANSTTTTTIKTTTASTSSNTSSSSSTTTITTTTAGVSTTTTTTTKPKQVVLINEIQFASKEGDKILANEEFIELYNPNPFSIDLTGWYLQRKTATGSSYSSLVPASLLENKIIPAYGFLLIAHSSSSYKNLAQVITDYSITENNTIVLKNPSREIIDKVGYGSASDCETSCTVSFNAGQSIQRKFVNNVFIDTDNNLNDFEVLDCPTPLGQKLESCNIEEIKDGSEQQNEAEPQNTNEQNQENTNQENTLEEINQTEASEIPEYSQEEILPVKNLMWHPLDENKSKIVLEFDIDGYPFIGNTELTNNLYFGLVFFLNENDPSKIPEHLYQKDFWEVKDLEVLKFSYPNCQGVTYPVSGIYFTSERNNCFSIGVPRGYAFLFNQLPKDNHFLIEIQGTNFNQNKIFQKDDFITLGIYSFSPYSDSALKLIDYSSKKYYFQEDFYYHPPSKIRDFQISFDKENLIINFSWQKGEDVDFNDSLTYEIGYTNKKPKNDFKEIDFWNSLTLLSLSNSYKYEFVEELQKYILKFPLKDLPNFNLVICEPTTLYFAMKVKDKYGFYSEISEILELNLSPFNQNFEKISDFIDNLKFYFDENGKMILEFDLIKRNECLKNYQYFVIKTGWDFESGLIFLSDGGAWNQEKNRASGRFQNINDKLYVSNYPPSLGHYKIEINNFYHFLINNGIPINSFTKERLEAELQKLGKNLNDIYIILAFGAADSNYRNWFFYNASTFNQPEIFRLTY